MTSRSTVLRRPSTGALPSTAATGLLLAALLGGCVAMAPPRTHVASEAEAWTPTPLTEPGFHRTYAATGGFRNGRPTGFAFTPDGSTLLFLRSGARDVVRALYTLDLASGEERELLTADRLLSGEGEELSAEERALRERLRMRARGITRFALNPDGTQILVPLSGRLFLFGRDDGRVRELPADGGYAFDPRFSPDGTKLACVRGGELYVIDLATGGQRKLTEGASETVSHGLAEFVAQEEMSRYRGFWWSPDSSALLVQTTDQSDVELLYASNPIDPAAEPSAARFPRAGTDNARVDLRILRADGRGEPVDVRWDQDAFPYLATVRWTEGAPLTLLVQDRRQQVEQILAAGADGRTTLLHEERDAAWLNLDQSVPRWVEVDGAPAFLWSTERDGASVLELRDARGGLLRSLTDAQLGYRSLLHVDEAAGTAFVNASADPTEQHVVRVSLAGEGASPLTNAPGQHRARFHEAREGEDDPPLWVHLAHTLAEGPTATVRRGATVVSAVRSVAEAPPFVPEVEHVTVGDEGFRALVIRPRNFEAGRRYPVLLSVYGGPGVVRVRKGRYLQLRDQAFADHGFIVVTLDGRGTPHRGREWERAIARDVITLPLADQVAGLEALGERFPELDLSRVGVYGWSFGGYFSAMAVMQRPDVFRVGVAGAPVCDWADYDTHYTERFMGLPDENDAGYRRANVLTYASDLERPLMIIHGTSDDNVYFVHALKMSDALLRAGHDHAFVPLSGSTHMVADPDVARSLEGRILDFLSAGLR
ncbi:MAG: DPP IV N-terminal domain-containing protein [Myxococcota bacterium]